MEKVLGLGGVFLRSPNPEALAKWYLDHLGINLVPSDYETPVWQQEAGPTVFSPFAQDTGYFGHPGQMAMLNFRVRDLAAMAAQLRAAGVEVTEDPDSPYPNGSFAWITDPDGNKVELWQPA